MNLEWSLLHYTGTSTWIWYYIHMLLEWMELAHEWNRTETPAYILLNFNFLWFCSFSQLLFLLLHNCRFCIWFFNLAYSETNIISYGTNINMNLQLHTPESGTSSQPGYQWMKTEVNPAYILLTFDFLWFCTTSQLLFLLLHNCRFCIWFFNLLWSKIGRASCRERVYVLV